MAEAEEKRRPVLIVTRSEAVPVLTGIVVAPVTRTIREIPTEIHLGEAEGLPVDCAASFDNLQRIRRSALAERVDSHDTGDEARPPFCPSGSTRHRAFSVRRSMPRR